MRVRSILAWTSLCLGAASTGVAQRSGTTISHGGLPAVSPDGRWIAFTARRDSLLPAGLYVIGADGAGERRIAEVRGGGRPQWISDGREILLASMNGRAVFDPATGAARPFPAPDGREWRFSPDGRWLLFTSGDFRSARISVSAADGTSPRALTSQQGSAFNGAWSPDGSQIAYTFVDSTRRAQVWVIHSDGSAQRQLTHFTSEEGGPQMPAWSPDGKTLAVQSTVSGQDPSQAHADIWLVEVASGAARKLGRRDRNWLDETPAFFPDGRRIAFQSDRTGVMEIWTMNADGSDPRQVTR